MELIVQLQDYLRESARSSYRAIPVSPFTLFVNPHDDRVFFNYAIPDEPVHGGLEAPLQRLRDACSEHQRQPRFEFVEQYAPELVPALQAAGFVEESRTQLMICTRETFLPATPVEGVTIVTLDETADLAAIQENLDTNSRGFDPTAAATTREEAERFRQRLQTRRAFTAYLDGRPVSAGMYTTPSNGMTELAGIATLEPYRRHGIASVLTAEATQTAFASGVDLVLLTAADERAGRVYERVGFRPVATALAYIDQQARAKQP